MQSTRPASLRRMMVRELVLVVLLLSELAVSKQTSGIPNYTIITDMSSQAVKLEANHS